MNHAIDVTAAISLLWLTGKIRRLHSWTAFSTADTCRRWALVAAIVCMAAVIGRLGERVLPLPWRSALQYLAAVMLLSPVIGILGARRPGFSAWPWFVVLPMIVVLQWPVISELLVGRADAVVLVPTPTIVGFVLVLVMGFGNYFGTLNTLAATVSGLAVLLIALPVTEFSDVVPSWAFPFGCLLLSFSVTLLPGRYWEIPVAAADERSDNVTLLWIDFRDLYGIVWAKRVMDRVNQFAVRERWDVRLTLDGFVPAGESLTEWSSDSVTPRQVEVLCWVLKRFVDPEFLARYVSVPTEPGQPHAKRPESGG
ncbi:MAG: hypothetical protein R3C59_19585 [Planctomycetaceae bacterium]